jgi:hypothetical protein
VPSLRTSLMNRRAVLCVAHQQQGSKVGHANTHDSTSSVGRSVTRCPTATSSAKRERRSDPTAEPYDALGLRCEPHSIRPRSVGRSGRPTVDMSVF